MKSCAETAKLVPKPDFRAVKCNQCATSSGGRDQPLSLPPSTDDYARGRQLMAAPAGFRRIEGGGEVPALASSLHMLEGVVFGLVRLKARP